MSEIIYNKLQRAKKTHILFGKHLLVKKPHDIGL